MVYVREAHPSDGNRPSKRVKIEQSKTFDVRKDIAQTCTAELKLGFPVLVDDMDDTVARAYDAMPDRLFVLGADGKVAYRGERGPRGFRVDEMEKALDRVLGSGR